MKKYIFILAIVLFCASCKKFLDVQPESEVAKEQLFSTEDGFKEALNGVYTHFAGSNLYGGNLTFSNLDIMAQNYQFTRIDFQKVAAFDYTDPGFVNKIKTIWAESYKGIGNVNQILDVIESKRGVFRDKNYELIKGECLALRAYMHFDLLRMFGQSFKSTTTTKVMPYVTTVSNKTTPFSSTAEIMEKVLADLNEAKALLKSSDPILDASYVVGYASNAKTTELKNASLFLQNRRHRCNYYAVAGELARAYLYKGDYVNSLSNAKEVIESLKFPWTLQEDFFNDDVAKRDRIFYNELLFGWYAPNSNDMLKTLFSNDGPDYSPTANQLNSIYNLGTVGADDWRYKQWFKLVKSTGNADRYYLQKYIVNANPIANLHPLMAPALRLSEMYLIAAEASFDSNPTKAVEYFNVLRNHRGIGSNLSSTITKTDFVTQIEGEYRKEFYGESQSFYMHKRLNLNIITTDGYIYPASDKIFVFPIPIDEQAYRY
ncbi:RagB/SusD family nutrient uptake outer membrane protein [Pedobacter sp. MW01-1-1]|uniref:RagB/SusD family nutrient uptake outer membrane protein n=1 Tax=Pedobacter sp. MW01-1-1 TaxID=3383027 RepID=UPI003FEEED4E